MLRPVRLFGALILFLILLITPHPVLASSVVINEILVHPSSGSDWVELYNPTDSTIDLTGWSLFDSTSQIKSLSGSLQSNSFISFDVSNRLNNGGDSIYLKNQSGLLIDSYSYSVDPGVDVSIGRSPDGSSWGILTAATKGTANSSPSQPTSTSTPNQPIATPTDIPAAVTISNLPDNISSNQTVIITVQLTDKPNSKFFLKGAFKKSSSSNYFGLTEVNGSWIKNIATFSNQYPITTDPAGNWKGLITVRPDPDDSGFTGPDAYTFKVGRYSNSGDGPLWSNQQTVFINSANSTDTSQNALTPPTIVQTKNNSNSFVKTASTGGQVLGKSSTATYAATPSSKPTESFKSSEKKFNPIKLIGIGLITISLGSLGYLYLKIKRIF